MKENVFSPDECLVRVLNRGTGGNITVTVTQGAKKWTKQVYFAADEERVVTVVCEGHEWGGGQTSYAVSP